MTPEWRGTEVIGPLKWLDYHQVYSSGEVLSRNDVTNPYDINLHCVTISNAPTKFTLTFRNYKSINNSSQPFPSSDLDWVNLIKKRIRQLTESSHLIKAIIFLSVFFSPAQQRCCLFPYLWRWCPSLFQTNNKCNSRSMPHFSSRNAI